VSKLKTFLKKILPLPARWSIQANEDLQHNLYARINALESVLIGSLSKTQTNNQQEATHSKLPVNWTISPKDAMFTGNMNHYMSVSASAMKCINTALSLANRTSSEIKTILDLPCGYGRVLRSLRAEFPHAEITACDLNKAAVDFCVQTFGVTGVYSDVDVQKIKLPSKFDLIWVGSLLTHLSEEMSQSFMDFFIKSLNPDGILVVSLHGRYSEAYQNKIGYIDPTLWSKIQSECNSKGWGYSDHKGVNGYGISMQKASHTIQILEKRDDLSILYYSERLWDAHQDVLAIANKNISGVSHSPSIDLKDCSICKASVTNFLAHGIRDDVRCPSCGCLERHRALWRFLQTDTNLLDDNKNKVKLLHFAPEQCFYNKFSAMSSIDYYAVDIVASKMTRDTIDIQSIKYSDNMFDFIICSHVLEHVPDDAKGMRELLRVLKDDGTAIINSPIHPAFDVTLEKPEYNTPELRQKYYGQSDHVRFYGRDYPEKLKKAGFNVTIVEPNKNLSDTELYRHGLLKDEQIFVCTPIKNHIMSPPPRDFMYVPKFLHIDIVNACNLRCPHCHRGNGLLDSSAERMSFELFKEIVCKAKKENIKSIALYNWTEPFLHEEILKFVKHIKDNGFQCILSTNLSLPIIPHLAEVLEMGVIMYVSVSGDTQETHEQYHHNSNIETVFKHLNIIADLKKCGKIDKSRITLKFLKFNYNEHCEKELQKLASECGFEFYISKGTTISENERNYYKSIKAINNDLNPHISHNRNSGICSWVYHGIELDFKGDISLCCVKPCLPAYAIGNYLRMTPVEILTNRYLHHMCNECHVERRQLTPEEKTYMTDLLFGE